MWLPLTDELAQQFNEFYILTEDLFISSILKGCCLSAVVTNSHSVKHSNMLTFFSFIDLLVGQKTFQFLWLPGHLHEEIPNWIFENPGVECKTFKVWCNTHVEFLLSSFPSGFIDLKNLDIGVHFHVSFSILPSHTAQWVYE